MGFYDGCNCDGCKRRYGRSSPLPQQVARAEKKVRKAKKRLRELRERLRKSEAAQ